VNIGPGGTLSSVFGLRPGLGQYNASPSSLTVEWKPSGDQTATFFVP
jgi:hypothetical protein